MRTYIIAEAGVNHNGSLEMALQLVDTALEAGVDAIKFQTFKADKLVTKNAPKAKYQQQTSGENESQYEMLKRLELSEADQKTILEYCGEKGIQFISTPFDLDSVELLTKTFNLPLIKVSSGDLNNAPLLLKIAKSAKSVILSTGMSTLGEIEDALGVLAFGYLGQGEKPSMENFRQAYISPAGQQVLAEKISLLHCTTEYPAPFAEVNLLVIETLRQAFGLKVGFSDHTSGIAIALAAVSRGAEIIEKHFTLDCNLPGPDHKASVEPQELQLMVKSIKEIEAALGSPIKTPSMTELKNLTVARKSLVAAEAIVQGAVFTEQNLVVKRPGTGISPYYYWDKLGKKAERNIGEGENI